MAMSEVTQLFNSESLSARVAAEVRSQAAKRGLKQVDVAGLLNLSQGQISGRMRGRIPFRLEELESLARHWGIDATELMPRRPADDRPSVGTGLPRLDLNQQPFEYMYDQVSGGHPIPEVGEGSPTFGGSVVPLFAPYDPRWTAEPKRATRPRPGRPFRPVVVRVTHSVAV